MIDRPDVSLRFRRAADGLVLVDRSCGGCASCTAGAGLWCAQPVGTGRDLTPAVPADRAGALGTALAAASAFLEAPAASTVLVVDQEDGPLALLVRALCQTHVLVGPDPFAASVKAELADLEPTGRAAVIVAGADARAAVKAVRRGGHVCVGDPGALMPTVTELVQREVTLVGPRTVAELVRRLDGDVWTAMVAAAA